MHAPHVLFFRGLSTYGHDHAQWSVFKFGPVYRHLQREFEARGAIFHPVLGMGVGTLSEVSARARRALESMPVWRDDLRPVHFVGHSAGGLVTRLLLDELGHRKLADGRPKIASVQTIGTPHLGSRLAELFVQMPMSHRGSAAVFRAAGYDLTSKREFFAALSAASVSAVLTRADAARFPDVRTGSLVCAPARRRWSHPMRAFHLISALRQFDVPSDGMIERDSQAFGQTIREFDLDHFQQVGLFGASRRFGHMCDSLVTFTRD